MAHAPVAVDGPLRLGAGAQADAEALDKALEDGFSTYNGLGLGLPGSRRLMDEFTIVSDVGHGTTVTMTKWIGKKG